MLERCIDVSVNDPSFRADDLEFTFAARRWAEIISRGDYQLYEKTFLETQKFFQSKFAEANAVGNKMIKTILLRVKERESQG